MNTVYKFDAAEIEPVIRDWFIKHYYPGESPDIMVEGILNKVTITVEEVEDATTKD